MNIGKLNFKKYFVMKKFLIKVREENIIYMIDMEIEDIIVSLISDRYLLFNFDKYLCVFF